MSRLRRILPIVVFSTLASVAACWGLSFVFPEFVMKPQFWLPVTALPVAISTPASFYLVRQTERVERLRSELGVAYDRMKRMAEHDGLTGVLNRMAFIDRVDDALQGEPGWLILADVDHFKSINDRFGHALGDAVLVAVAVAMRSAVRDQDLVARIGGEEFAIFLPGIEPAGAIARAERIRRDVAALRIADPHGNAIQVTISAGVASTGSSIRVLDGLHQADAAMYAAKDSGRNQVALAA